jgi:hypothetical protein
VKTGDKNEPKKIQDTFFSEIFLSKLQCPTTGADLTFTGSEFQTSSNLKYPLLDAIPWLVPYPEFSLDYWLGKYTELNTYYENRLLALKKELSKKNLNSTKNRLQKIESALKHNQKTVHALLQPLVDLSTRTNQEGSDKIPGHQTLSLYFSNLFRDWSWETGENEASLQIVQKILPADWQPRNFIVVGSGASRFARDIHRFYNLTTTIALDINPLLVLIAKKMLENKSIQLFELPTAPIFLNDVAIGNELKNLSSKIDGFHLLFADVQKLPFKDKISDSVFTPWVIDILPIEFSKLAQRINRILAPNGEWINFGPLGFMSSEESKCYTFDEIKEILTQQGFKLLSHSVSEIAYLHSPRSSQKRQEKVLCFRAVKVMDAPEEAFQYLPEWLLDYTQPIPLIDEIKEHQLKAKVNADIFFSIDGRKSIQDLIALMSAHYKMSPEAAKLTIVNLLTRFFESKARRS